MMKPKLLTWIVFCLIFIGVGCSVDQPTVTPSATAVSQVTVPTETAVPPTVTVEPTPVVTETAVPPPTITPVPTSVLPSPPDWVLYFLWDSENVPSGLGDPVQTLYKAIPSETPEEWQIEPILQQLIGQPQSVLSLDKTTLAITPLEDLNGDGFVSMQGYARGFDGLNIFAYSFSDGSYERVTEDFPRSLVTVLEGNRILAQYDSGELRIVDMDDLSVQQLTASISDDIHWINPSPDRTLLAVNLSSAQLQLIDTQSGEIKRVTKDIGGFPVKSAWSPDGHWLAIAQPASGHFFLVDTVTAEAIQIPDLGNVHFPTWSPNGDRLFLVREVPNGSELLFLDVESHTVERIVSMLAEASDPHWSPDEKFIAFISKQNEGIGLELLDLADNSLHELWFDAEVQRFQIFSWSPDGQWLLFHVGQEPLNIVEDESSLFILHQNSGKVFQILDSSGKYDPYGFIWLEK